MQDNAPRHVAPPERLVRAPANTYLVHAVVCQLSRDAPELVATLMEKLVRRRLKRLERVLDSQGGVIIRKMPNGLLTYFETAEAALFGACEMQRRCAAIPQIPDAQVALKIGIHIAASRRISSSLIDPAEATAGKLATLLDQASVVLSESVAEALDPSLLEKTAPVPNEGSEIAAYAVDWNTLPILRTPTLRSKRASTTGTASRSPDAEIKIWQGTKTVCVGADHPVLTIGRDPKSDIPLICPKASRQHCRIVFRQGDHVLVDLSSNGTYLTMNNGPEILIKKNMLTLTGRGRISFGQSWQKGGDHAFEFEVGNGEL